MAAILVEIEDAIKRKKKQHKTSANRTCTYNVMSKIINKHINANTWLNRDVLNNYKCMLTRKKSYPYQFQWIFHIIFDWHCLWGWTGTCNESGSSQSRPCHGGNWFSNWAGGRSNGYIRREYYWCSYYQLGERNKILTYKAKASFLCHQRASGLCV